MTSNTRKIVKNASALYLRTAVSILIQLFAVRYLLKYLGVESYGLYGLVGSIIVIAESIRGLFSSTIQRFINIELGRNNKGELQEIFNVSLRIVSVISALAIVFALIGGFCILPFLKIPLHLQSAAYYILIFSSVTLGLHLLNTVFDAVIIAHERFFFLAMVSIGQSILKFASVLCLILFSQDRVVWYALFIMLVAFIVIAINVVFCKVQYRDLIVLSKVNNKRYYREIGSFASYKLVGTFSTAIQTSGIDFLLNLFGGLVANTARTIAYQVINAVNVLVWNLIAGFSPRIITLYGEGKYDEFNKLVMLMIKCNLIINITLGFVISLFVEPILKIWLGEIPEYTPWFIRIIFIYFIVRVFQDGLDMIFTTIGNLKKFQLYLGATQIVSVGLSAVLLWLGAPFYFVFISMTFMEIIFVILALISVNGICGFSVANFLKKIIIPASIYLSVLILVFSITPEELKNQSNFVPLCAYGIIAFIVSCAFGCIMLFGSKSISNLRLLFSRNNK